MPRPSIQELEEYTRKRMKMGIAEVLDLQNDFLLCDALYSRILDKRGEDVLISDLSRAEATVVCLWNVGGIIRDGGFQYLFEANVQGIDSHVAVAERLKEIGCGNTTAAFYKALALFPDNQPHLESSERIRHYRAVPRKTRHEIDRQFWDGSDELEQKLAGFIRQNRGEFMCLA